MATPPDTGEERETEETPVTCVCGRPLTDPVSRGRGLGPRCYKRLRARPAPRIVGTHTARAHPLAVPARPGQLALDWGDQDDDEPDPYQPRPITDVPTGALL
ncbi:DUF6011 domain-containing protein [Streptomyces sp. NBC_00334]|uniref:DUF6011 domain-containing protein n=1 Tax=Streptomyces sp. NBC_00334 TaxID=2975713 RepID=UPI002E2D1BB2|nr:DUF6011 domain-containing protein [Streptomyces sp. NBC_00334]